MYISTSKRAFETLCLSVSMYVLTVSTYVTHFFYPYLGPGCTREDGPKPANFLAAKNLDLGKIPYLERLSHIGLLPLQSKFCSICSRLSSE